jgi:DNA-binding beta-propeller fold protein YncE
MMYERYSCFTVMRHAMNSFGFFRTCSAFTAGVALAACATSGSSVAPPSIGQLTAQTLATTQHQIYISDEGANAVWIFPAGVNDPSPTAEITDGINEPLGIWVDAKGVLYVANFASGTSNGSVTEYRPGTTHPSLTIPNLMSPASVAVDRKGTLYVGEDTDAARTPTIAEYAPGATQPTKTVSATSITGIPFMGGMTVDPAGNLYVAFFQYFVPPVHVVEFAPGLTNERDLKLQGLDDLNFLPGLGRDRAGTLYVGTMAGINVYAAGSTSPTRVIKTGFSQYLTATNAGTLYVPNQSLVAVYAPGSGKPHRTIQTSLVLPEGAAVH